MISYDFMKNIAIILTTCMCINVTYFCRAERRYVCFVHPWLYIISHLHETELLDWSYNYTVNYSGQEERNLSPHAARKSISDEQNCTVRNRNVIIVRLSIYPVRKIKPFKLLKWKAKRLALVNFPTGKFGSSQNKVHFGRTDRYDRVNGSAHNQK